MSKSKQTANTRLVAVPQQTPAPHLERQLAQTRIRTLLHVADGHATASDLALHTGVSQAHMSNVLTGRRNMSPALADKLNALIDSHEQMHAHPFGGKAA